MPPCPFSPTHSAGDEILTALYELLGRTAGGGKKGVEGAADGCGGGGSEGKGDDSADPVAAEPSPSVVLRESYGRKGAIQKATQGKSKGKWEMTVEVPAQSVRGFEKLPGKILGVKGVFVNKLRRDHELTWLQGRWDTTTQRRLASGKCVDVHEVHVVAKASLSKQEARTSLDAAYKWISDQVRACDHEREMHKVLTGGKGSNSGAGEGASGTGDGQREKSKTRLCRHWEKAKLADGQACSYGPTCAFAHGPSELRSEPRRPDGWRGGGGREDGARGGQGGYHGYQ